MAISREQKEARIAELKAEFEKSQMVVLTAYKGLSVDDIQTLRANLKDVAGNYRVVKNSLIVRAAKEHYGEDVDFSDLEGPVALAFGYEDTVAPAKAVMDFAKDRDVLEPIGAINLEGHRFSADEVKRLAALPSREQLTAQLVGTIAAPLSGFVGVLSGVPRGFMTALSAVADKKAQEAA